MKNSKHLSNVQFVQAIISYDKDISDEQDELYIGSIRLEKNDRQYMQDTPQVTWTVVDGKSVLVCDLEEDENDLRSLGEGHCNFGLRAEDISEKMDVATLWLERYEEVPKEIRLDLIVDDKEISINLEID